MMSLVGNQWNLLYVAGPKLQQDKYDILVSYNSKAKLRISVSNRDAA